VIRNAYWATFYLLIFRAGTIAGIMLIPFVIAVPSKVIPFYQMALESKFTRSFSELWKDSVKAKS